MSNNPFHDLTTKKDRIRRENKELEELKRETEFEDKDGRALVIAALSTIIPFVAFLCGFLYLILKVLFDL